MSFGVDVEAAEWIEERSRWRLRVRHLATGAVYAHESQFLFCATGQLVTPRELDVPGAESFEGPIFHSARWRHDVDLDGKRVVIFGNGSTTAQIVPAIVERTVHLTQMVRTKHWILPPIDRALAGGMRWMLRYVPGAVFLQRLLVFAVAEHELRGFPLTEAGARFRAGRRTKAERYMRQTAPARYQDLLIPDFEVGCKRRIFDSGYLESLYRDNLTLTDEAPLEIVAGGVRTAKGVIGADVIIMANGFVTNHFLDGLEIAGRGGKTVREHWDEFGGAEAYNCSVMSGFPNLFVLLGPNAVTGHTSAIMAAENSINYALRVIKPVLDGAAGAATLRRGAEEAYVARLQAALRQTVWFSGCSSWYVRGLPGGRTWNAMSHPWSQAHHFWYRSLFPVWADWQFSGPVTEKRSSGRLLLVGVLILVSACAAALFAFMKKDEVAWDISQVSNSLIKRLAMRMQLGLRSYLFHST